MTKHGVVLLGGLAVGKTALCLKLAYGTFSDSFHFPNDECYTVLIQLDDEPVYLDIYDSKREIVDIERISCYSKYRGHIFVYSIISRESFDSVSKYFQLVQESEYRTCPYLLIGTKCDIEDKRQVSYEEGMELSKTLGCSFFEISCKNGTNIPEAFANITKQVKSLEERIEGNDRVKIK